MRAKRNIIVVCKQNNFRKNHQYFDLNVCTMRNMVDRNCDYDNFVCITDQTISDPSIQVIPINDEPKHKSWWSKIEVFNPDLPVEGDCLYIDLDACVMHNIDCLFEYKPGEPLKMFNDNCCKIGARHMYNSSVIRFTPGDYAHIWHDYQRRWEYIQAHNFFGDDQYTSALDKSSTCFPLDWITRYQDNLDPTAHINQKIVVFGQGVKPWSCENPQIQGAYT